MGAASRGVLQRALLAAALVVLPLVSPTAGAVSYRALPDRDLIERSPLIIRARVESTSARDFGGGMVNTEVEVEVLEVLKGAQPESRITVVVPGGDLGERGWWVEEAPRFQVGEETLLFLGRWNERLYALTELGLSKFEILMDPRGERFATRAMFLAGISRILESGSEGDVDSAEEVRPLDSFLDLIRNPGPVPPSSFQVLGTRPSPAGPLRGLPGGPQPQWTEIGALVRWPWGTSGTTTVTYQPAGGQPNLSDGSNGVSRMTNAVLSWPGVSGTNIRVGTPTSGTGGTIQITLDDVTGGSPPFSSPCWTTALCGAGVLGCAGPSWSGTHTFDGRTYNSAVAGYLFMRRYSCSTNADTFENALAHEFGHVLGFGHSDQSISAKDPDQTQFSTNHCLATMRSCIGVCGGSCGSTNNLRVPFSLGSDDQTAARYTYPSSTAPPVANFTFAPPSPNPAQVVSFTDTSTNAPTSWSWSFGDPGSGAQNTSTSQNPTHTFATGGTYSVTLTASNAGGSNPVTKQVVVASGPTVTAISPNFGTTAGGTAVTITGTGFVATPTVSIGGSAATGVSFVSSTTLTATTPAHAAGTVNVVVTNPDTQAGSLTNGYYFVSAPSATKWYPVTPCRILDTRLADGPLGGPVLSANQTRTFDVTTTPTTCGIPATAKALSGNYTITGATGTGELRVFPGNGVPVVASAIFYRAGRVLANNGNLTLSTDGNGTFGVTNVSTGAVHFILDVTGYFQ